MSKWTTRRKFLIGVGMAGVAGCSGTSTDSSTGTPPTDTTETSTRPETTEPATTTGVESKWTKTTRSAWSVTELRDGTLYVIGYGSDSSATLFAFTAETGAQTWAVELSAYNYQNLFRVAGDSIVTAPTVRKRADGSVRWRGTTGATTTFEPQFVTEEAVYAKQIGNDTGTRLVKRTLDSGNQAWHCPFNLAGGIHTRYVPSTVGFHTIRRTSDDALELVARSAETGNLTWSQRITADQPTLLGATDETLVGYDAGANRRQPPYRLFGFDVQTGEKKWTETLQVLQLYPYDDSIKSYVFVDGSVVIPVFDVVDTNESEGGTRRFFVRRYRLSDGTLEWEQRIPKASHPYDDSVLSMRKDDTSVYLGRSVANGSVAMRTFELARDTGKIGASAPVHAFSVAENRLFGWVPGAGQYGRSLAMYAI